MTRKVFAAAAIVVALVILSASPAAAHTVAGVSASNYRSEITDVQPSYEPVLTVRLLDLGRRVRLTNRGGVEVIVYGYNGEPYLRVGPRGTFENTHSPAVYLNKTTPGGATTSTTLPATADPSATPSWHKRSGSTTVTWRDRRTRWEGQPPAAVTADPSVPHTAGTFTIGLVYGGDPIIVTGRIIWEPPPPLTPWLLLGAAALAITALAGFSRRWGPLVHAALAALIATDVVHAFATAVAARDPALVMLMKVLVGGFFGTAAWIAGLFCLGPLDRNNEDALLGAGGVAIFIALYGGLSDLPTLTHSQVPYAGPADAARAAVVLVVGIGAGIIAATGIVFRRRALMRAGTAAAGTDVESGS
ncbi:MAG TPA: hypothetical protein VM143_13785 [Acidimicrobiales bacterium]|nr:hypothetical protein [Acidimicrobiales bacterium]